MRLKNRKAQTSEGNKKQEKIIAVKFKPTSLFFF